MTLKMTEHHTVVGVVVHCYRVIQTREGGASGISGISYAANQIGHRARIHHVFSLYYVTCSRRGEKNSLTIVRS